LAITRDIEFLVKLNAVAGGEMWILAAASALGEALNLTAFEDFPVVVLDHLACEESWERSLSVLVSSPQGVWWPPNLIEKGPTASYGAKPKTSSPDLAGPNEPVVRRFFMSAKAPCVILASQNSDEYLRREVVRLGGYDVLSKSAPHNVITRTIEFAWFWSQHSATTVTPDSSKRGLSRTSASNKESRH
jgi:hypothetical protein